MNSQENIIREFNLNEIFQKSKKLSKRHSLKEDELIGYELEEDNNEPQPKTDNQVESLESKKEKWCSGRIMLYSVPHCTNKRETVEGFPGAVFYYVQQKSKVLWTAK